MSTSTKISFAINTTPYLDVVRQNLVIKVNELLRLGIAPTISRESELNQFVALFTVAYIKDFLEESFIRRLYKKSEIRYTENTKKVIGLFYPDAPDNLLAKFANSIIIDTLEDEVSLNSHQYPFHTWTLVSKNRMQVIAISDGDYRVLQWEREHIDKHGKYHEEPLLRG